MTVLAVPRSIATSPPDPNRLGRERRRRFELREPPERTSHPGYALRARRHDRLDRRERISRAVHGLHLAVALRRLGAGAGPLPAAPLLDHVAKFRDVRPPGRGFC